MTKFYLANKIPLILWIQQNLLSVSIQNPTSSSIILVVQNEYLTYLANAKTQYINHVDINQNGSEWVHRKVPGFQSLYCVPSSSDPPHNTMPKTQNNYTVQYQFESLTLAELKRLVSEIIGILGIKPSKVLDDENQEVKL